MAYDAFISYSHAADGRLAPRLQQGLQKLAKPWWRRRALGVFRDETGLAVNPHLWSSITDALDESEWFILLASEEAAGSPWIDREISYWKEHKDPSRILPVVTGGTWQWDTSSDDFDWSASTAVPAALAGVFVSEPRHLDLSWAKAEDQLDLRNTRFRGNVAEIAAAVRGVPKDELEGEDVRQHRRTLRWAWGAALALALLTLLSAGTAAAAVRNADEAQRNEAAALAAQDQADANATEAQQNADQAAANAEEAQRQRFQADDNAARATQSQTEAEAQRAKAEANAIEARDNADQAAANAAEAQQNADEAAANAAEAQRNADQAAANAAAAQQNADRANVARAEADKSAVEAQSLAASLEVSNKDLAATNSALVSSNANLERQTRIATSRQLAASSLSNIDAHYDRALLEAVAANATAPTTQARDSLLRSLLAHPELRVQFRPPDGALGLAISPSGDTVVTADYGTQQARVWDAPTGRQRFELEFGGDPIYGAAFGPDDRVAISLPVDNVVVDTRTGGVVSRIPATKDLLGPIAFAPGGRSVAVDTGSAIELWDPSAAPRLVEVIPTLDVSHLAYSSDSAWLAWAEGPPGELPGAEQVFVQHLTDGHRIGPLPSNGPVSALALSRDGRTLEVVEADVVSFWDVETGSRTTQREVTSGAVLAASPDQRLLAIGTPNSIRFERALTGEPVGTPILGDPPPLSLGYSYAFTADGAALGLLDNDRSVKIIDVVAPTTPKLGRVLTSFVSGSAFTFSPDGRRAAVDGPNGVSIVEMSSGRVEHDRLDVATGLGRFSPDGNWFAFFSPAHALYILDLLGGEVRSIPSDGSEPFAAPVFSSDGKIVATTMVDYSIPASTLHFWDVATATPSARRPPATSGFPTDVAFAPDGTVAVALYGGATELFSPGRPSRHVGSVGDATVKFSPDGRFLAIDDINGVTILSMPTATPVGEGLTAHDNDSSITSVAFDLEEGLIATGESDGTIQLWDLASSTPIGPPIRGGTIPFDSLVFSAPGRLLSGGHEVVEWSLDMASLLQRACTSANREMTEAEWIQLVGDTLPYRPPCAAYREE
jgi:WD40 repeat protein